MTETDPLGNDSTFTYDSIGNLTSSTDRLGRVTQFSYDGLNRLIDEIWLAADGTQVNNFVYTYDANSNLLSAGSTEFGYGFTYDALNRVTSVSNVEIPVLPDFTLNYSYDAFGNLTQIQDNSGVTVDQTFDSRNLLESIGWSGGPIDEARVDYSYDGRGFITGVDRFSDLAGTNLVSETTQSFDALGRITEISHLNSTGSVVADYEFTFDAASQLTQQTINGDAINYTFDELGQLLTSDSVINPNEDFTYDDNGNRISGDNVIGPNNQLLSDGTYDYQYDAEGNLIRRTEISTGEFTEYEFDHRNRLVSATRFSSGGIILSDSDFVYNVFDELIQRRVDADGAGPEAVETFATVYHNGNAWADFDTDGNLITQYLFGVGLDSNIARYRVGEGTAWYLTDQLGSVRDIVDANGNLINHIEYDSYGNILLETDSAAGDRFKFTGREFQSELGFYYYRARFYDPSSVRFTSQDPIGFRGGDQNLYGYVGNRPTTFVDPSGNAAIPGKVAEFLFSKKGIATATGFAGFGIGFVCGVLDALFTHDPKNGPFSIEAASGKVFASAVLGGVIGAGIGALGAAAPAAAAPLFGVVFTSIGLAFNVANVATSPSVNTAVLRVSCFVLETASGVAIGRRLKTAAQNFFKPKKGDVAFGLNTINKVGGQQSKFAGDAKNGNSLGGDLSNAPASGPARRRAVAVNTTSGAKEILSDTGGRLKFNTTGFTPRNTPDSVTDFEFDIIKNDPFLLDRVDFLDAEGLKIPTVEVIGINGIGN